MAIPFANTRVNVTRNPVMPETDGYDPPPNANGPSIVAEDVEACITLPSGAASFVGGERTTFNATMQCDVCGLRKDDIVTDQMDGTNWRCLWVREQLGLGIDHMVASLRLVEGAT